MLTWIVAYDVRSNRSRLKILNALKKEGLPLQKSVFLVQAERSAARKLVRTLAELTDPRTDRVCAWPLRVRWKIQQICHPAAAAPMNEDFVIG